MSRPPVPPHLRKPRNGRTIKEAAKLTGLTEQTIKRWTSEPREIYLTRAEQRRTQIRDLKAAEPKLSLRAIAARLGCSVGTVHNALKQG
ncbi:hypothetical protein KEM60_02960 [Austwickia sp. TVS 96-490-7B]|uniref:helix-turn-helix domain-containing protein n=1 Tax=Austwickia sp. TVS 96-490-7B TaxID=2830843 RepID=UPI001C56A8B8|nr:helix-turn-helix domain-containing protein [Austwickia sp. TVS 96-490-7B]MBW3086731.1 hypothetical protein [Austwickia sp. TVS 96-490-7B]